MAKKIPIVSGEYQVEILDIIRKTNNDNEVINYSFKLAVRDENVWFTLYATEFFNPKDPNCSLVNLAKRTLPHYPDLKKLNPYHFLGETVLMRLTVSKARNGDEFLHIRYFKPFEEDEEFEEETNNEE